jgi:hypothetical protein
MKSIASLAQCDAGGRSPAVSAIGRAYRTNEMRNLPGSSVIGRCAEFSNQTNCFEGAFNFASHSARSPESMFDVIATSKNNQRAIQLAHIAQIKAECLCEEITLREFVALPDA